jgi:hypothetical protein
LSAEPNTSKYKRRWRCVCTCGTEKIVHEHHLRDGASKSCGCLVREVTKAAKTIHGMHGTPTYHSWNAMRARCERPTNNRFADYGARGIAVCERWRSSFSNFLADMGVCPPGMSIERMDNDGNYEPGNCRWATDMEQANNSRHNHILEHAGRSQSCTAWARELGINVKAIYARLRRGDSVERALR